MLEAVEHLNVGGPDAVRRAAESPALSATLYEADDEDHRAVYSRIRSLAKRAWVAFTLATTFAGAVMTWERFADLLPLV